MLKGMGIKEMLHSMLEFSVAAFANQRGKNDLTNIQKGELMLSLIKDIARDVVNSINKETGSNLPEIK
jgi:hypothetical protein